MDSVCDGGRVEYALEAHHRPTATVAPRREIAARLDSRIVRKHVKLK